jgi:cell division protein FtsL
MATVAIPLPRARRRPRYSTQRAGARAIIPDAYYVKRIDHSRLRREADPAKRRECYSLLGLATLAFAFLMFLAWEHLQCVRLGYQIEGLKQQKAGLEESNRQFRLQEASLADPQRIDALARRRLGMSVPVPQQIVRWDAGDASRAAGAPQFARNLVAPAGPVTAPPSSSYAGTGADISKREP